MEKTVAGKADKVAAAMRAGGATAKQLAAKAYDLATDPAVQEKARKLAENGAKAYRGFNSPEAKQAFRRAADILKKTSRK